MCSTPWVPLHWYYFASPASLAVPMFAAIFAVPFFSVLYQRSARPMRSEMRMWSGARPHHVEKRDPGDDVTFSDRGALVAIHGRTGRRGLGGCRSRVRLVSSGGRGRPGRSDRSRGRQARLAGQAGPLQVMMRAGAAASARFRWWTPGLRVGPTKPVVRALRRSPAFVPEGGGGQGDEVVGHLLFTRIAVRTSTTR